MKNVRTTPPFLGLGPWIGLVALSPYLAVWAQGRTGLYLQAALVAALSLMGLVCGLVRVKRRGLPPASLARMVTVGVALYTAVALIGAVLGFIRGNDLELVAAQLVSMLLLPTGFVASALLAGPSPRVQAANWLFLSGLLAAAIHVVYWLFRLPTQDPTMRLYLPNGISFAGLAPLALMMDLAVAGGSSHRQRRRATIGLAVLFLYIAGTQTRSLWLATLCSVLVYVWHRRLWRWFLRPGLIASVIAVATLAWTLGTAAVSWWDAPRSDVLPTRAFEQPFWRGLPGTDVTNGSDRSRALSTLRWRRTERTRFYPVTERFDVVGETVFRLSGEFRSEADGPGWLALYFEDADETVISSTVLQIRPHDDWRRLSEVCQSPPDARTARLSVGCGPDSTGDFWARDVRLERIGEGLFPVLVHQVVFATRRFALLPKAAMHGGITQDSSVSYRLTESRAVLGAVRGSNLVTILFGRGLGARLDFTSLGFDVSGRLVRFTNPNYLHNFYAFLLYKTGIMGLVTVLTAFGMWSISLHRGGRRSAASFDQAFYSAVFAALCGYMVWGVVAPEILDFRNAPVWGAVLGAAALTRGRSS